VSSQRASMTPTARVERVFITGGTHFMKTPELFSGFSFETRVLLTNVASIASNTRYVDEDMNRCFFQKDLDDPERTTTLESRRAKELNAVMGPKGTADAADFIIDLHNTTADTGVALMMAPKDEQSCGRRPSHRPRSDCARVQLERIADRLADAPICRKARHDL